MIIFSIISKIDILYVGCIYPVAGFPDLPGTNREPVLAFFGDFGYWSVAEWLWLQTMYPVAGFPDLPGTNREPVLAFFGLVNLALPKKGFYARDTFSGSGFYLF